MEDSYSLYIYIKSIIQQIPLKKCQYIHAIKTLSIVNNLSWTKQDSTGITDNHDKVYHSEQMYTGLS